MSSKEIFTTTLGLTYTDVLEMSIFKWPKVMSTLAFILEGRTETRSLKISLMAVPASPHQLSLLQQILKPVLWFLKYFLFFF